MLLVLHCNAYNFFDSFSFLKIFLYGIGKTNIVIGFQLRSTFWLV